MSRANKPACLNCIFISCRILDSQLKGLGFCWCTFTLAETVETRCARCETVCLFAVSEEDKQLMSPFTCAPTASLIIEKEKQVKAKAHPPGASKILSKAREKVEQEQKKVSG